MGKPTTTNNAVSTPVINSQPVTIEKINVEKLFREHHNHLIRFVQRYVRNIDDAKDVVQNTFMESVRCADNFSGISKPSTWLFGIALNLARNHVRRSYANVSQEYDDELMNEIIDIDADPSSLIEKRQLAYRVETILSELPMKIRDTFEAVLDGECTYEKAAEQMNVPIGTVRSRVSRVRNRIRTALN